LVNVIHDWNDPCALEVLALAAMPMGPKTKLLILDRVMPERLEASPLARAMPFSI
jgi:hypothetical protein